MGIEWLGFAGTGLVVVAYLPQVIHLTKEGCTAGISIGAYITWATAAIFLLLYAVAKQDIVFISLQIYQLLVTGIILFFSFKHRGQNCDQHGGSCPTGQQ